MGKVSPTASLHTWWMLVTHLEKGSKRGAYGRHPNVYIYVFKLVSCNYNFQVLQSGWGHVCLKKVQFNPWSGKGRGHACSIHEMRWRLGHGTWVQCTDLCVLTGWIRLHAWSWLCSAHHHVWSLGGGQFVRTQSAYVTPPPIIQSQNCPLPKVVTLNIWCPWGDPILTTPWGFK